MTAISSLSEAKMILYDEQIEFVFIYMIN